MGGKKSTDNWNARVWNDDRGIEKARQRNGVFRRRMSYRRCKLSVYIIENSQTPTLLARTSCFLRFTA